MLTKIIEIAKRVSENSGVNFGEETSIIMDMELSSMEFFSFITEIEGAFDIHISERELNRIETLGDLAEIVEKKVN